MGLEFSTQRTVIYNAFFRMREKERERGEEENSGGRGGGKDGECKGERKVGEKERKR